MKKIILISCFSLLMWNCGEKEESENKNKDQWTAEQKEEVLTYLQTEKNMVCGKSLRKKKNGCDCIFEIVSDEFTYDEFQEWENGRISETKHLTERWEKRSSEIDACEK